MTKLNNDPTLGCEAGFGNPHDHVFSVTVLSRSQRPILTGKALILDGCSVFWPDIPIPRTIKLKHAAFLHDLDGTVIMIANLHSCEKSTRVHYHFRVL